MRSQDGSDIDCEIGRWRRFLGVRAATQRKQAQRKQAHRKQARRKRVLRMQVLREQTARSSALGECMRPIQ